MIGQSSSTSSTSSSADSSSSEDDSDCEPLDIPFGWASEKDPKTDAPVSQHVPLTFAQILPGMKEVYGVEPKPPSQQDLHLYKRYLYYARSFEISKCTRSLADTRPCRGKCVDQQNYQGARPTSY